MDMNDDSLLGLAILFVQQAPISAHERNRPLKPAKTGRHSLKLTYEWGVPQKRSEMAL
jgi:hypothetical protein